MSKVLVPLASGFEEIEAMSIIDILRRAEIEVVVAGLGKKQVVGAHGVKVQADVHIEDTNSSNFDMIVLPGGLPGATNLQKDETVQKLLKEFDKQNKPIGAICAAPVALMSAGVLKENYTCYPSFETNIREKGYTANKDIVSDKNIITSRGPGTAMTFGLAIVSKLCGDEKSNEIRSQLLL
ncbi:MAG: DJ-1/PfpI family protein [Epsilonproteobacteria bacterium]|nr:DJ-1/PfpI family protein [Campylobacterota bacterium]